MADFEVVEFRRYLIKPAERENFARYFETYFPEAFQHAGAIIFGHFLERENDSVFTWIRGFADMEARAAVNHAFYAGPLWREHASTMNDRLIDHTNVLLVRPLTPERAVAVLHAVDPVLEPDGAQGIVVAHIFPVRADSVDAFAHHAEATFADYRSAGAHEVGVVVSLDVPNNFPPLPFRTDGPYLVWLGVLEGDAALEAEFAPLAERSSQSLAATGLLSGTPELVILDPTTRSRLRWLP